MAGEMNDLVTDEAAFAAGRQRITLTPVPGQDASKQPFSSDIFRELAEVGAQGIIVLGEKNVEFCNERARVLNGVPKDVLDVSKPWLDFLEFQKERGDFGTGKAAEDHLNGLIANFKKREVMQIELCAENGRIIRSDRIPNSVGGLTLVMTDITELKQREKQLESAILHAQRAEKSKTDFMARISREIRTPLTGLLGMAEMLSATPLDEEQRMLANVMRDSGENLLSIVTDVLDFSKIDLGEVQLSDDIVSPMEVINDAANIAAPRCVEKGLDWSVDVSPDLPHHVICDGTRLRQVIDILVDNAIKFTTKGKVSAQLKSLGRTGDRVRMRVEVRDTGTGIPPGEVDSIFDRFSSINEQPEKDRDGVGLGLAIAKALIELRGGDLQLESTVGEGSRFWFDVDLGVPDV